MEAQAMQIGKQGSKIMKQILQPSFIMCYSCVTLNIAAIHQQMTSTCKGIGFDELGWEELSMRR